MLEELLPEYDSIVIHYGEIALKRSRRGRFERILHRNLEELTGVKIKRLQGRLIINLEPGMDAAGLLEKIGRAFGVVWYAPAIRASSLEELRDKLLDILPRVRVRSIKLVVKRSNKSFPKTSLEVARELGGELASRLGLKVDLKKPDRVVQVEITEDGIYASLMKLRGPGGLPLGASGKILGLYSGGACSALACWFMMKRGCRIDLLHVHDEELGEAVIRSELMRNAERLLEYASRIRVYLASSSPLLSLIEEAPSVEKPTIRIAFMLRLGEGVARLKGYPGLVLGSRLEGSVELDGLLQMLSMRILPVHMPLIALTSEEVSRRCEALGLHALTGRRENYPAIPDPLDLWRRLEEPVRRAIERLEVYDLRLGAEPARIT